MCLEVGLAHCRRCGDSSAIMSLGVMDDEHTQTAKTVKVQTTCKTTTIAAMMVKVMNGVDVVVAQNCAKTVSMPHFTEIEQETST